MNKSNRQQFKLETDLNTLRSFVAVVEEGGFSAAAKRVYRTQSAISVQMAKLEEQLNIKLLERTSRSVEITPAGEKFLSYASRILELADEATFAVCVPKEKTVLRVGFAEYLAPTNLRALLDDFHALHPDCEVSMVIGLGSPLLEALDNGDIDLLISCPESNDGEALWEEQLTWTGTADFSADNTDPIELVVMPPPCSYRKIVFDALTHMAKPWKIALQANSIEAVQSAIRSGFGATILPVSAIRDDMPLLTDDNLPKLPTSTVMSFIRSDLSHPYAQYFIDFLTSRKRET